ncbi:hypothetical protein JZK55_09570 [Dissulfurispira thermophila]|uniref:Zinc-ribbon domain-containing protein n=1 Tax=Dissulfurispira thermophila TaxID=2715679 RepID=A0A7G1GZV0_9BACT|nr:zinc ribbon domain-containing protein [Dissulfurispira thermophila]BCB96035.1 hypothetical protein JZK55_09570 [Dissulfurispira thermophila]
MKQVKPGRVPSLMEFIGSIIAILFGIFWTIGAISLEAPFVFPLFGFVFIIAGIGMAVYHYNNAFGKRRISEYDIIDTSEEDETIKQIRDEKDDVETAGYCPYCGNPVKEVFLFCPKCGRRIK